MTSPDEVRPLNKADYEAALKKANSKTKEEPLLALEFNISSGKLVLPYKKGIELMGLLEHAHLFRDYWSDVPIYKTLEDEVVLRPFAQDDVNAAKVGILLGIPFNEAKKLKEASP